MSRLIGINHVALEVGDIEEAVEWYGQFFEFQLRGRGARMAFIDMGDQFLALAATGPHEADHERHFGLVVDDKEATRAALQQAGVPVGERGSLDFRDPWGNQIQVVDYRDIQFMKTTAVLDALGLTRLDKSDAALRELRDKGIEA
jgi:catechol 2,3-dioxygenase-like lactoylglutathione lyase family enzyme